MRPGSYFQAITAPLPQRLRLGVGSLMLHKLRSALAVLGILIGVTAVIWLVAMGEGVSYQAQQQIKDLGATNIIVRSVKPPQEKTRDKDELCLTYGLLRDDYDRILANIPTISRAVPLREISREARNSGCTCQRDARQGRNKPFWACFQTAGVRNCLRHSPRVLALRRCFRRFLAETISRSSMKGCVDSFPLHAEERLFFQ